MNNERIQQLLAELYQIDSSLREHEDQLVRALDILLSAKPDLKPTPEFVAQLKGELMVLAHDLKKHSIPSNNFFSFFTMQNKFVPSLIVAVAMIVAVGAALFVNRPAPQVSFRGESTRVAQNAFGPLAGSQQTGTPTAPSFGGRGGGGGGYGGTTVARPESGGGGMDKSAMSMPVDMPYPGAVVYEYYYDGEPLELSDKTVEVAKRIKGGLAPLGNITRSISGINLSSFSSMGVQNVNLSEDKDYGYSIFVDFSEGSLSINQNWMRWPNPMALCREQTCVDQYRIRPDQLLADDEAIKITDAFLDTHGVDRSTLGQPEVQNEWRAMYEKMSAPERLAFWVPEQITVVYPLIVDGKTVYEQGLGAKMGINVSVDVRSKKVSNLYNIFSQKYEKSSYDAETDFSTILKFVQQGGYQMYPYRPEGATVKKIKVGTPVLGYMRYWLPRENTSDELLVPALVFPVLGDIDPYNQARNVVVPLAKELLSQPEGSTPGVGGGPVQIMPMKTVNEKTTLPPSDVGGQ